MAKRKNARALFEVINQSKGWPKPPRPREEVFASAVGTARPGVLALPRWWFNRSAADVASTPKHSPLRNSRPVMREVHANADTLAAVAPAQSPVADRQVDFSDRYSAAPMTLDARTREAAGSAPPAIISCEAPIAEQAIIEAASEPTNTIAFLPGDETDEVSDPLGVRPSQKNYTFAIYIACGILALLPVILICKYVFGSRPTALGAQPTAVLRKGPAHPSVMDVHRGPIASAEHTTPARPLPADPAQPAHPTFNEPRPSVGVVSHDANRAANLNYVVVQSYPLKETKMAQEACDFLSKNGVPCTIEQDVRGWNNRLTIVGIDGFTGRSSPEFHDYIAKIEKLSTQFASDRSFRAFKPIAVKWGRS